MNNPSILSCGEVLWDLFPQVVRFGGAAANFACHAAILGADVAMLSAVGDDPRGSEAIAVLQSFGVDTSLVQHNADAPTGSVGVTVDGSGQPKFEIHTGSAWDRIAWLPQLEARIEKADAIYFGTLGQRGELSRSTIQRVLDRAKQQGKLRVLDIILRRPFFDAALIRDAIARSNVLKLSDDELPEIAAACDISLANGPEHALRAILAVHALSVVAMTRGANGALLVSATETVDQPGVPTVVQDTVGAGDAFTAALTIGLLRGETLAATAQLACKTAAAACAHAGAVPSAVPAKIHP